MGQLFPHELRGAFSGKKVYLCMLACGALVRVPASHKQLVSSAKRYLIVFFSSAADTNIYISDLISPMPSPSLPMVSCPASQLPSSWILPKESSSKTSSCRTSSNKFWLLHLLNSLTTQTSFTLTLKQMWCVSISILTRASVLSAIGCRSTVPRANAFDAGLGNQSRSMCGGRLPIFSNVSTRGGLSSMEGKL